MLPLAGEYRYLRVQIRNDLTRREAIALIGHELQHALGDRRCERSPRHDEPDQAVRADRTRQQRRSRLRHRCGAEYGSAGPARAGGLSDCFRSPLLAARRQLPGAKRRRAANPRALSQQRHVPDTLSLRDSHDRPVQMAYRDRDRHVPRLPFALPQPRAQLAGLQRARARPGAGSPPSRCSNASSSSPSSGPTSTSSS